MPELQALVSSPSSKSRFAIKLDSEAESSESTDPSDFLIRIKPTSTRPSSPSTATPSTLTTLTAESEDLPDLIVYETSYPNYPLILASGSIKRAGGQAHLTFSSIKVLEDGSESRPSSDADVSIFINLRDAMEADPKLVWQRTENGNIVTEGNAQGAIEKKFWKKAVARRADIGILYENGEVRKEIPIGLRGKGVKGKRGGGKGKGKVIKEMKARSEDEGSSSD
jgi:2'-phosphotransferase